VGSDQAALQVFAAIRVNVSGGQRPEAGRHAVYGGIRRCKQLYTLTRSRHGFEGLAADLDEHSVTGHSHDVVGLQT
jgi:hypothetical protein